MRLLRSGVRGAVKCGYGHTHVSSARVEHDHARWRKAKAKRIRAARSRRINARRSK